MVTDRSAQTKLLRSNTASHSKLVQYTLHSKAQNFALRVCVSYDYHNKQRMFPYTALSWSVQWRHDAFDHHALGVRSLIPLSRAV